MGSARPCARRACGSRSPARRTPRRSTRDRRRAGSDRARGPPAWRPAWRPTRSAVAGRTSTSVTSSSVQDREVREQHERLEERVVGVVEAGPVGTGGPVGPDHVVVDQEVVVAGVLESLDERHELVGIDRRELRLGEDRSESHAVSLAEVAEAAERVRVRQPRRVSRRRRPRSVPRWRSSSKSARAHSACDQTSGHVAERLAPTGIELLGLEAGEHVGRARRPGRCASGRPSIASAVTAHHDAGTNGASPARSRRSRRAGSGRGTARQPSEAMVASTSRSRPRVARRTARSKDDEQQRRGVGAGPRRRSGAANRRLGSRRAPVSRTSSRDADP